MAVPGRLSRPTTSHIRSLCRSTASSVIIHHNKQSTSLLLCLPPSSRAFHATANPQILSSLLATTHTALTTLHTTTSLPWALTIPLAALLLRLTVTTPLTILTRRATQRRLALQPLLHAWSHQARRQNMRKSDSLGPAAVFRGINADMRDKRRELYTRWGCQGWKMWLPLGQLPVWLLMVETLRGMVGMEKGLLGMMEERLGRLLIWMGLVSKGSADEVEPGIELGPELAAGGMVERALGMEVLGHKDIVVEAVPFEPSMAAEGMLWFPDLTVADPMITLPFMLSAVMLVNIYSGLPKSIPGVGISKWKRRLTRTLTLVALAVGPLTLQMPSAMLLYWTSSGLWACGQNLLLDHYMPMKPPVKPCEPRNRNLELLSNHDKRNT